MYPPAHFIESRPEILLAAMRAHSFVTVITAVDGVPLASHVRSSASSSPSNAWKAS
jgi:predicted FMN-binding regulatory protein PaiB